VLFRSSGKKRLRRSEECNPGSASRHNTVFSDPIIWRIHCIALTIVRFTSTPAVRFAQIAVMSADGFANGSSRSEAAPSELVACYSALRRQFLFIHWLKWSAWSPRKEIGSEASVSTTPIRALSLAASAPAGDSPISRRRRSLSECQSGSGPGRENNPFDAQPPSARSVAVKGPKSLGLGACRCEIRIVVIGASLSAAGQRQRCSQ
jgi:hypothetical protein